MVPLQLKVNCSQKKELTPINIEMLQEALDKINELEEQLAKAKWISINDEKPIQGTNCLVDNGINVYSCYYSSECVFEISGTPEGKITNVINWQYTPRPKHKSN